MGATARARLSLACWALTPGLFLACKTSDNGVADVLVVAQVAVSPPTATLTTQETLQFDAVPKTAGGLILPPRDVVWSSSAPTVASVSSSGVVRALALGSASIRATVDGVQGEAAITVTPVPVDHIA